MEKRVLSISDDVSAATSMPGAGVGAGIGLAVLSQDDPLLDTLEEVVTSDHAITLCTGESELAECVMSGKCGVALIDAATVPGSIGELTTRLRQQFPDLVLVVAGGAEHQGQLAAQITRGDVYRFLHKPVSAQRVRLFIEAALRRHDEEHATARGRAALPGTGAAAGGASGGAGAPTSFVPPSAPTGGSKPPLPIAAMAAVGALVVAGGLWFALRDSKPAETAATGAPAASAAARGPQGEAKPALDAPTKALIEQADKAYARGELVMPAGRSAADLYGQVLKKIPAQPQATAGMDKVVNALAGLAEKAILEGKLDDATRDIESAKALQPENVRIAFLAAQLGKERERLLLTKARQAAASGDLGRALAVLDSGGAAGAGSGAGLVAEARRSLEAQQVNERVRELLKLGNERLRSGALTEPASDNARFYLESARALAPREAGVTRLSDQLENRALAEARAAVNRGDTAAANRALRSAADVGVAASDLEPLRAQLASAQTNTRAAEVGRLSALVAQRIGQGRLVEPANDSAKSYFNALLAADANSPTVASLRPPLGRAMVGEARAALTRSDFAATQRWLSEAEEIGAPASEVATLNAEMQAARERLQQRTQVVGAGSLKRVRSADPVYPREARNKNVTGWVDLEFTVMPDGSVNDIKVSASQPAAVFDIAAVEALNKWRFEPVRRDGAAVEQRARLRMRFQIE